MPSFLPSSRWPTSCSGCQPGHARARTMRSPSEARRARPEKHNKADSARGDGNAVRSVADLDAARLAGIEIEVIEADGERRYALDVLGQLVDDVLATLLVERDEQRVDVLRGLEQLLDGDLVVIAMRDNIVGRPRARHDCL